MSERRYRTAMGDCRELIKTLGDASVAAVVTDPPYALKFMNSKWDTGEVVHDVEFWRDVLRVLKPGGHLLTFGGTRTYHRMVCSIEDADFEIRDCLMWMYGQGMPKSANVSKHLDRMAGADREVIAEGSPVKRMIPGADQNATGSWIKDNGRVFVPTITAPATEEAQQWDGWGSALKPAWEPIVLCRKSIKGTIAANVLAHGVGGLNVDGCRIGRASDDVPGWHKTGSYGRTDGFLGEDTFKIRDMPVEEVQARCGSKGRWPANVVLQHAENCQLVGTRRVKGCPAIVTQGGQDGGGYGVGVDVTRPRHTEFQGYGDADGIEKVEEWACVPGCPVRELDGQSGKRSSGGPHGGQGGGKKSKGSPFSEGWNVGLTHGDQGGVSRFLYQAKPSKSERERDLLGVVSCVKCGGLNTTTHIDPETGREGRCLRNNHNTLKSVDLMRWLVRLVVPPGETVLDPFMGSGTTGVAALFEGGRFLGMEQDPRSYEIARARLKWAAEQNVSLISD